MFLNKSVKASFLCFYVLCFSVVVFLLLLKHSHTKLIRYISVCRLSFLFSDLQHSVLSGLDIDYTESKLANIEWWNKTARLVD